MNLLSNLMSGQDELQAILSNYLTAAEVPGRRMRQETNDLMMKNANQAGILNSPTGQDIINRNLALRDAEYGSAVAGQVGNWGVSLAGLLNGIMEAAKQREFASNEAAKQRDAAVQMARLQQYELPLDLQRDIIPINVKAFEESTNAYRRLYPDWNQDPTQNYLQSLMAGRGGGGGGAMGSAFGQDAAAKHRQEAADWFGWDKKPAPLPEQDGPWGWGAPPPGWQQSNMPGGGPGDWAQSTASDFLPGWGGGP